MSMRLPLLIVVLAQCTPGTAAYAANDQVEVQVWQIQANGPANKGGGGGAAPTQPYSVEELCRLRAALTQLHLAAANSVQQLVIQRSEISARYEEAAAALKVCGAAASCATQERDRLSG